MPIRKQKGLAALRRLFILLLLLVGALLVSCGTTGPGTDTSSTNGSTTNSYDTPTPAVGLSTAGATMESVPYDDIMYDSSHNTQRVNFVTYEFAGGTVVAKATSVLIACSVFFNTTTGANNPPVYDVHIFSGTADLSYDGQTLKLHLNIDGAGNDDDWVGSINSDESWKLTSTRESIIENVPYVPATDTPDSVKQQYQGKACTLLG
jgi:hypothetical protein